jgi:pimeloyl-ACP methyl ester carboxylesterase
MASDYLYQTFEILQLIGVDVDIILIPGLWLDGSTWDPVTAELERAGHRVQSLTLPGLESPTADRSRVTLDDHVAAVVAAIDRAEEPAAAALAFCAADARPERVARLVYVGGFPSSDGEPFMQGLAADGDGVPFPGWERFEGPDSADLDAPTRSALLERFMPHPVGVLTGTVRLKDDRRYAVPATAICPEYSPAELQEWIDTGEIPELARTKELELVDLDSGHWPQFTQPVQLARLILAAARS